MTSAGTVAADSAVREWRLRPDGINLRDTDLSNPEHEPANAHLPGALLHYCILLTGFGTVFLGPMLPTFTALLRLSDRGAGALLAAQFTGAFLGGWTTAAPLNRALLRGLVAACVGFGGVALAASHAPSLGWVLPCLVILGFGIGQTLTAVNLLASEKWVHHRGAALTLLNFTWSFGALTAPLLLLRLLRSAPAWSVLAGFGVLLAAALVVVLVWRKAPAALPGTNGSAPAGLPRSAYLFFSFLLFLYGGVETSLGGWLTTFDHRYGATGGWRGMAVSTTAFWASLTLTRLLAPVLLRFVSEKVLLRAGLAGAAASLLLMLTATGTPAIAGCAALAGLSLSPWFPLVLSTFVSAGATASQAGKIIAVSGLGAAALPWLVGQVSAATSSLRLALLLPAAGVVVLLLLSFGRGGSLPPAATSKSV